jgi:thiosulfate/3-mercaptopyruvate sulfurtransferase
MSGYANPHILAETSWLDANRGDAPVRIVDARWPMPREGREAYLKEHIPGAVYLDVTSDLADPTSAKGDE